MPAAAASKQQLIFAGGVNASVPAHLVPEDTVQTSTNIDFSVERGAARARRGYTPYFVTGTSHGAQYKSYDTHEVNSGFHYTAELPSGAGRLRFSGGPVSYTHIAPTTDNSTEFVRYKNYTYIAGGNLLWKDDGTNTTEWIKQIPVAPSVTVSTGSAISILAVSTATVATLEGSSTVASSTNTTAGDPTTGRSTLIKVTSLNLGSNGGIAVGSNGIVYTQIGFSDPQNVYRVSVDFAVDAITLATNTQTLTSGTTTTTTTTTAITTGFANYWHGEYLPNIGRSLMAAYPSVDQLTGAAQQQGTIAVTPQQIASIQGLINSDQQTPQLNISFSANVVSAMGIPISSFQYIGTWTGTGQDPWANITAVRITVESYVTVQNTYLTGMNLQGDANHVLTDMNVGYTWYQTYAEIDAHGNIVGESAPSPSIGPLKCVNAQAVVVTNGTATGTQHGITHIVTYRQGGYAQAPYQVGTQSYAVKTMTDTLSDIQALLLNTPMAVNVASPVNFGFWSTVSSEPFYDRIYLANTNTLRWSQIGRPDQFLTTNTAVIGDPGDAITGLIVWPPGMVIVTWRHVYEITGSIFEGPNADYVIQEAAPRRGSIAPQTIIKTPYGIPLVNWDGITMYQPGAGVDQALEWVTEQIGDAFRDQGNNDPANLNGNRVPILTQELVNASACFAENKLYITTPTGTNTANDTVFVLDFTTKKCWWYQYQNNGAVMPVNSLSWDFVDNKIYAGGTDGFYSLETSASDLNGTAAGTGTAGVPWSFVTRAWTVPNDTLVENFAVEYIGGPFEVDAIYDSTATVTLGTCSSTSKTYAHFSLGGIVENNLTFRLAQSVYSTNGTVTSVNAFVPHTAVYGITWDAIPHPQKVHFYQTDYNDNNYPGDKLWDVLFADIGMLQANTSINHSNSQSISSVGTVTAVTFVDGVAVMTNTIISSDTTGAGRRIYTFSFPAETYGEVAYTTYTAANLFKLWDHRYEARNEPARTTVWRTTIESLDEAICDAFDVDINPGGTTFGTCYVDNVALMTATITGSQRQSYTWKLPVEVYGRTIFVLYNYGSGSTGYFKHYQTWFHRRPEPDRWTNFVSNRVSTQEHHFDAHEVDVNPLGNTVLGTALVDGTAYGTFTYTGTLRERFVNAFPPETYGKTVWTQFSVVEADGTGLNPRGGRFKYFSDHFIGTEEPDRLTQVQKILPPYPSEHYLKTWILQANPLGTMTGHLLIDGTQVYTATFTGTIRETYNVGIDNPAVVALQTATAVEARYTGLLFKHYHTSIESAPKPFGKTTWAMAYKKTGGVSQIDMARFWSIDVECAPGPNVLMTSIWDIDGQPGFSTNTMTLTQGIRNYIDRVPFPPGGRGRLFQQRLSFSSPVKVWRTILDEEHIGAKGVARESITGTPQESGYSAFEFANA